MDAATLARSARHHLARLILTAVGKAEGDGLTPTEIIDVLEDAIDAVASTAELAAEAPHVH